MIATVGVQGAPADRVVLNGAAREIDAISTRIAARMMEDDQVALVPHRSEMARLRKGRRQNVLPVSDPGLCSQTEHKLLQWTSLPSATMAESKRRPPVLPQ